ncbi:hypothetical protein PoB_000355800 [Plakobranchus ocellatus]|uniref:Uncharacterized protein n=1 Tax=Plakobranchus ocellatus TaxID=259542 RepID=A0AAV3Y3Y1_9GAST|nr:hypothetical protein PoB_000355800 [Plakobranchus ocellatus]
MQPTTPPPPSQQWNKQLEQQQHHLHHHSSGPSNWSSNSTTTTTVTAVSPKGARPATLAHGLPLQDREQSRGIAPCRNRETRKAEKWKGDEKGRGSYYNDTTIITMRLSSGHIVAD